MFNFSNNLGGLLLSIFHWSTFSLFFSATTTQTYLKNIYTMNQFDQPEQKAYENCYPFIYYLEHGKIYYEQAKDSPLIIKPILLFYGFVHLIKACILTVDPDYPETTSVLAHGVSSRKRKKRQFNFFHDEVKFQKTGLFPFMAEKLFHVKQLEGDKISMELLFKQIPELNNLMVQIENQPTFIHVHKNMDELSIPKKILDSYHMTENRFIDYFTSKSLENYSFLHSQGEQLTFKRDDGNGYDFTPLKYNLDTDSFVLPIIKDNSLQFHEILVHYLLLYNLSMIARYETEWWSELVKTMPNKDFPFIETFLHISLNKGPFLINQYFLSKK